MNLKELTIKEAHELLENREKNLVKLNSFLLEIGEFYK